MDVLFIYILFIYFIIYPLINFQRFLHVIHHKKRIFFLIFCCKSHQVTSLESLDATPPKPSTYWITRVVFGIEKEERLQSSLGVIDYFFLLEHLKQGLAAHEKFFQVKIVWFLY